ncbi:FAD dependent oxidoreductase [Pseudarcicella hirudinis]|uniref:FAD dependent oxidoreductase n=1 Tax=Pseudarcicella hirudinis TaxID=1079859 RepID=A0A1I5VF69_9BACT|nr:FAD-dependent oxidoreductase [Pseudarcicella hirudinis]SFQ06198.1 FAD dependent oxidoreductase [Pseudarcicella hirudinis]
MNFLQTDILIVGGGVGGCACAIAACEAGLNVIVTEETDWLGGQFTAQATPPDEHGWIERFGSTKSYRLFRENVRKYYRENYELTEEALNNPVLNPGNGWVSPLCAEPKVFLQVIEGILGKYTASSQLTILKECIALEAENEGDYVNSVTIQNVKTGENTKITAKYFVDATELGDLLPITKTEFVTGSESRNDTGEPSAKNEADPHNCQAFSVCFALSYHPDEDWTIEKPEKYDFWKDFIPQITPAWSGKLLSLTGLNPRTLEPVHYKFMPNNEPNKAFAGLWTYRRIIHKDNFKRGIYFSDITLVNYPQIDYMLGDLCNASGEERARMIKEAKQQSLSFIYYLQTEKGLKGLKLRPDVVGTEDGLIKYPYIRESRRIRAEFTIKEQHISAQARFPEKTAQKFQDSVGLGYYRIDLHPSTGGDNYVDVESLPFQIPLGALIPKRVENLLPVCKNIGTTHITNGCYRVHPIEWNVGESIGNLLAFCLSEELTPRQVRNDSEHFQVFQSILMKSGIETEWPENLNLEEGDPHIHAM